MQMLVDAEAQVVGDPLADAGGVVVVDIGRDRADDGDRRASSARKQRDAKRMLAKAVVMRPGEPDAAAGGCRARRRGRA